MQPKVCSQEHVFNTQHHCRFNLYLHFYCFGCKVLGELPVLQPLAMSSLCAQVKLFQWLCISRSFLRQHSCSYVSAVLAGVIAQLSMPDQDKQSGEGQDAASPNMTMEVDWDLGVSGHSDDITEEDEVVPSLACLCKAQAQELGPAMPVQSTRIPLQLSPMCFRIFVNCNQNIQQLSGQSRLQTCMQRHRVCTECFTRRMHSQWLGRI